jgi:hypothetical protein
VPVRDSEGGPYAVESFDADVVDEGLNEGFSCGVGALFECCLELCSQPFQVVVAGRRRPVVVIWGEGGASL